MSDPDRGLPPFATGGNSTTEGSPAAGGAPAVGATAGDSATAGDQLDGPGGITISTGRVLDGPGGWLAGPFEAGLAALGLASPGAPPTIPVALGSAAAVATWMAFSLFTRRRQDAQPIAPDDVLQASAATGYPIASVPIPVPPVDPESSMPRWRRPSLLEARRTDPVRSPSAPRPSLVFGFGSGEASVRHERRIVRYAFSPLLDRPDEILAARIGELVAGDEVAIRERSGAYCLVLSPDGREGWVHRMTLGDSSSRGPAANGAGESRVEPEAENALAALLAARGLR